MPVAYRRVGSIFYFFINAITILNWKTHNFVKIGKPNVRILKNILLFQKKIFFISYAVSLFIGLFFGGELKMIGLAFLWIAPFTQYFFYDVKNKNQYFYYYNVGISKNMLWTSTFVIGFINLLILSFL